MNAPDRPPAHAAAAALHRQVARFGTVGLIATAINAVVYLALVRSALSPLAANAGGFAAAFGVSFLGHRHWTFAHQPTQLATALPRFIVTALIGFASNTLLTWLLVEQIRLPPAAALAGIVLITPALLFVLSKYWAFAAAVSEKGEPADKPGSV